MFALETWDVDAYAETLDKELFGSDLHRSKHKKRKKSKSTEEVAVLKKAKKDATNSSNTSKEDELIINFGNTPCVNKKQRKKMDLQKKELIKCKACKPTQEVINSASCVALEKFKSKQDLNSSAMANVNILNDDKVAKCRAQNFNSTEEKSHVQSIKQPKKPKNKKSNKIVSTDTVPIMNDCKISSNIQFREKVTSKVKNNTQIANSVKKITNVQEVNHTQFDTSRLKAILSHEGKSYKTQNKVCKQVQQSNTKCLVSVQKKLKSTGNDSNDLRAQLLGRLHGARFRYLNEQIYQQPSSATKQMFDNDPEAFQIYHEGFQSQAARWPVNPVDKMIEFVSSRSASLVVADFGCGDAKIARSVSNKVHSFDLVAVNNHVTVCDIAKVPLNDNSVDIAVFCLSLMGTNFVTFLKEANRVLKKKGSLLVSEIVSRIEDLSAFIDGISELGFQIVNQESTKIFVWLEFTKTRNCVTTKTYDVSLLPCLYKKR